MTEEEKLRLRQIHELRAVAHWGKHHDTTHDAWPRDDAEWRQTPHGAPWDTNVIMAQWHLTFARKLRDAGLLE